jgi:DNA-binding response OmpR family regulator
MSRVDLLVAVRQEQVARYRQHLDAYPDYHVELVSDQTDALTILADREKHVDVLVLDNGMAQAFDFVTELRQSYPRIFIVLVDEDADFATPGQADDISTEPFENDDLNRRITRLMSDRELETLRADALPAVRQFAKELRKAFYDEDGKYQAAVNACAELGFTYVAFYRVESDAETLTLKAQTGASDLCALALAVAAPDGLTARVFKSGHTRLATADDAAAEPLIGEGRLPVVSYIPVTLSNQRYGVLVAGKNQANSISQDNILMLELIAAQVASVISKDVS